ncbi:MAG: benzoyl-CoA reductase, bzd-type, subunit N [Candidatus Thermoplasmatota archaeon]|nr:benzoyl-CoA reductase, bzd-type, subunit N [Candidatus Thermoplasmatota archaeon]
MEHLKQFKQWEKNRHQYAKDWKKKTGGKVMGYFCTYVPEEILYAAGVLTVRILGSHEPQDVTEPHIFAMFCPFCRDCLAQGLKNRYTYLDGLMIAQSCLHIRQAYTSWIKHRPVEFEKFLYMPHKVQSPHAYEYLTDELRIFKKEVEDWTGKKISESDLEKAIDTYNENRRLMKQLYNLRKRDNPPITGEEVMEVVMAMQMTDKEEHNKLLKQLLKNLENYTPDRAVGSRLMILGSEDDDTVFMNMVENCGATFVIDDHCTGSRYFWNEVETGKDQVAQIAARYIDRIPCPTKDWEERKRIPHILNLCKDWNVNGVIIMQQKFCDPHELDYVAIQKALDDTGIPTLFLEFDVTVPIGQFKIRVEAFLEMIGEDDLF